MTDAEEGTTLECTTHAMCQCTATKLTELQREVEFLQSYLRGVEARNAWYETSLRLIKAQQVEPQKEAVRALQFSEADRKRTAALLGIDPACLTLTLPTPSGSKG